VPRRVRKLVRSLPAASWLGSVFVPLSLREGCLLWSFAYIAGRDLFALVWLLAQRRRSKELELLVCAMNSHR
jgi:hypothetical protein